MTVEQAAIAREAGHLSKRHYQKELAGLATARVLALRRGREVSVPFERNLRHFTEADAGPSYGE